MNSFAAPELSPPSARSPSQSFDAPQLSFLPEQRGVLVQATVDAATNIALVDSIQMKLEEEFQQQRVTLNRFYQELPEARARVAQIETEIAKKVNFLTQLETRYIEASDANQKSNLAMRKQIELLRQAGTNADRAAIEALFYRVIPKDANAAFVAPSEEMSVPLHALVHETYMLKSSIGDREIPHYSLIDNFDVIQTTDDPEQNNCGYAKIVRVFRRTSKADVIQFLFTNTKLQDQQKSATFFGIVRRYNSTSIEFHMQNLVVLCWFGRPDAETAEYPATRGETFQITLIGTDYGHHTHINSNSQSTTLNQQIGSILKGHAAAFGIRQQQQQSSYGVTPSHAETLSIPVEWNKVAWLRRVPLEYIDGNQHSENCRIECVPLAVRVKFGSHPDAPQNVQSVFSVLCFHELTRQVFWKPFDVNNIAALKKTATTNNNDDCGVDIGVCRCQGSFTKKLYDSRELLSSTKISDSSPLKSLKDSGVIDKEALDYYAILESVMHNCNMEPATILTASREKSNAVRFVKSTLPDLGHSVVVHSNSNDDDNNNNFVTPSGRQRQQLKRSKGVAFEESNDNDIEIQRLMQPLKQLKKESTTADTSTSSTASTSKSGFLVAITTNGDPKKQSSCSICGVEGAKQTTHFHPNHGYRKKLPQEDLKKWYDTLSIEDREKLLKVTE